MSTKETKAITLEEEFNAIMRIRSVDSDSAMEWAKGFIGYADANPDAVRDEGEVGMWFTNAMLRGMEKAWRREDERKKCSRLSTFAWEGWEVVKFLYVLAGTLALVLILSAWQMGMRLEP